MTDHPEKTSSPGRHQQRDAGVIEPKHVTLSPDPADYHVPPREESGPEGYPPTTIQGTFKPIEDRGPESPVPSAQEQKNEAEKP